MLRTSRIFEETILESAIRSNVRPSNDVAFVVGSNVSICGVNH